MLGSGMPILNAIGSSLFSVGSFGLTTAINYALSGLVSWTVAFFFLVGGVGGGFLGARSAMRLAADRRTLTTIFACVIFAVAIYMLARTGFPPLAVDTVRSTIDSAGRLWVATVDDATRLSARSGKACPRT